MIIGIDATNLNKGGGRTHLIEFINHLNKFKHRFIKVVIWGNTQTLSLLPDSSWLDKETVKELNSNLLLREYWIRKKLIERVNYHNCSILFVPGSRRLTNFSPQVTMCRNMLPFQIEERSRFKYSWNWVRYVLLKRSQLSSFQKSDGVIFLTEFAKDTVSSSSNIPIENFFIVPHGINHRFKSLPRLQKSLCQFSNNNPIKVLYVSTVNLYKHQWNVVQAISQLRRNGIPISLDLVGSNYKPALDRLKKVINDLDSDLVDFINYHDEVDYNQLHEFYHTSDIAVFASSCENMPNILIEKMSAGLPIVCSNKGPMPEILGDAGIFFDPESVEDLKKALLNLINDPELRTFISKKAYLLAEQYNWNKCVDETLRVFENILTMRN